MTNQQIQAAIAYYTGENVSAVETYHDRIGAIAVQAKMAAGATYYFLLGAGRGPCRTVEATSDALEEVEFESWPPTEGRTSW